jgi:hypothetical protein
MLFVRTRLLLLILLGVNVIVESPELLDNIVVNCQLMLSLPKFKVILFPLA